jgi:arylsulfatase A-like enzyme
MTGFNRREMLKLIGSGGTVVATAGLCAEAVPRTPQPNVLIILTDDQGYGDFSCHGNPVLKTPNVDRLHAESVRFTQFHSAPMCTPTRGQLLTGVDACRNRATSVTAGRAVLRRDLATMANVFGYSGYRTGLFGKWHLGDNYPYRPMDRGFHEAVYHLGYGISSAPEFDNDYFNGRYRHNGAVRSFTGYCTDFWFSRAMDWMLEQHRKEQPFFCYLPSNAPHGPAWVADKYKKMYDQPGLPAAFFGMIANLDENFGKLEEFLRRTGLRDNTIVIFMTDNGGTAGVKVFNAGMRANKTQLYDGGHRVPCFVRWPAGGIRSGVDVDVQAQMQDILPTLIELCGLKKPETAAFDGTSLAGLLSPTAKPIADRMLVVQYGQVPEKWDSCVIWNRWRLVFGKELYDIRIDPGQKEDLAAKNADVVFRMRTYYEAWWAGVEPGLKEFLPISIGSDQENPTFLSSSDWESVYCDNMQTVLEGSNGRLGGPRGGPWNILVERDGEYEIVLSRYPADRNIQLTAGLPPAKLTAGELPAGKALPIAGARLMVAGVEQSRKTAPADTGAVFRVNLKRGTKTRLHGWFQDGENRDLVGAYYAVVKRL